MLKDKLNEIEKHKSKLASLQQALLEDLHSILGYAKRSALIQELQGLGGPKRRKTTSRKTKKTAARKTAPRKAATKKVAAKATKRRKRTTITPQLKNDIIAAVKGGATGAAVAKQFGVSVPTVQNIKKAAGLIKKR